ncbi:chondroitin sulfate synthase 1 [Parasteatoda tepidariorum]|uniref:chondroitin sulfate synthase 1 n=1 Tax=Parasteatoda tepidariorum TaxID=114398 RepID=UPI001C7195F7|nr:chondroitin sulfate synthase 1 [Parasteatoda tepidariorum]XP_015927514.2 chondroitin sulfate synthase 1 [Parasteatoda tepidariorum]
MAGISPVWRLLFGAIIGFIITTKLRYILLQKSPCFATFGKSASFQNQSHSETLIEDVVNISELSEDKKLLFIGVMTAQKYLETRALAIHNTWGQTVPGKLIFFSSSTSKSNFPLPLVPLKNVDDSYPPQKKSFLMLKFMHDNFIDDFEWFMRADDDVYIRTELLEKFLRSVNSSKPQFIGQAGLGNKAEFGQLSLQPDENFCMGGPGMILSRDTLRLVIPHIRYCLKNLYSTHEDVEVGRCVRKFVGIPCTWSYEMQSIFYHSFSGEEVFTGRLKTKEIHRAITLHPIKQPPYLYRMHSYFHGLHTQDLRYNALNLYRDILEMENLLQDTKPFGNNDLINHYNISILGMKPVLNKFFPVNRDETLTWDFISKHIFSISSINPKKRLEAYQQLAVSDVVMEVMEIINKYSKQRGRVIDFKEILYGYIRENPLFGVDYILDMLLTYRKYRGKKMTVPVRRHAYLQKAFSQLEFKEDINQNSVPSLTDMMNTKINIIVPLYGRLENFKRFLNNIEVVFLKTGEKVHLAVVYFESEQDDSTETKMILEDLKRRYPAYDLRLIEAKGPFSRAVALEVGAKAFSPYSLLFFVDVDIVLDVGVLNRIRLNTIKSKQVYFPVVFSEYDPEYLENDSEIPSLSEERGYWRQFGYGIVSIYNEDLRQVGGFDTSIRGWGKEDVDLYSKVVRSNLTVLRAADPGIVHVFHPITCSPELEDSQYEMCWGSKLSSLASQKTLAKIILSNKQKYLSSRE